MSKPYEELEFTDRFLFSKIMYAHPELCKELLELILQRPLARIAYKNYEETIEMLPDAKGVRLDVYTMDEEEKVYDIEMQIKAEDDLGRRSRYYHSMIDLSLLEQGQKYFELNDVYVIFICKTKPRKDFRNAVYTFRNHCLEDSGIFLEDGAWTIFLNAQCEMDGLSDNMRSFLSYVRSGKADADDSDLVEKLDDAVRLARKNQKWRKEYMTVQDLLDERFEEGRKEGRNERQAEIDSERARADEAAARADEAERKLAEYKEKYGIQE